MTIKKSTNRLNESEPGRAAITEQLESIFEGAGAFAWDYVDLDTAYWQNDHATLVIMIDPNEFGKGLNIADALGKMAHFAQSIRADELNVEKRGHYTVLRFWWD